MESLKHRLLEAIDAVDERVATRRDGLHARPGRPGEEEQTALLKRGLLEAAGDAARFFEEHSGRYLEFVPVAFCGFGTCIPWHNARFDVDDDALKYGRKIMVLAGLGAMSDA